MDSSYEYYSYANVVLYRKLGTRVEILTPFGSWMHASHGSKELNAPTIPHSYEPRTKTEALALAKTLAISRRS